MIPIGKRLFNLDVSNEERDRIASLLNEDDSLFNDLKDCALKNTQTKMMLDKHQRVNGFRPGTPAFHERASELIFLAVKSGSATPMQWSVYKVTVSDYLGDDLNILLNKEECDEKATFEECLNAICKSSYEYDVSRSTLERFYHLFPSRRLANTESMLDKCDTPSPDILIQKKVASVKEDLEESIHSSANELKASIDELRLDLEKRLELEKINITNYIDQLSLDDAINQSISDITAELDGLKASLAQQDRDIKYIKSKQEDVSYGDVITGLKHKLDSHADDVKTLLNKQDMLEEGIKVKIRKGMLDLEHELKKDFREVLEANHIGDDVGSSSWSEYVSPLVDHDVLDGVPSGTKITEDKYVVDFYHNLLDVNPAYSLSSACILHVLFKSCPVIILKDEVEVDVWLKTLSWQEYAIRMAASPSWHSEKDWGFGARAIFSRHESIPKVLTIYDYDIGFIDGYLLPSLRLWRAKRYHPLHAKMILVPSSGGDAVQHHRIMESAGYIGADVREDIQQSVGQFNKTWERIEKNTPKYHQKKTTSVSVSHYEEWLESVYISESPKYDDLKKYFDLAQTVGVRLELPVLQRYKTIKNELERYLLQEYAHLYAYTTTIGPWIEKSYGENRSEELNDRLIEYAL